MNCVIQKTVLLENCVSRRLPVLISPTYLFLFFNQALNLVVVIFCIYFTNSFLDGTFNDLGYKWMEAYLRTDEVL